VGGAVQDLGVRTRRLVVVVARRARDCGRTGRTILAAARRRWPTALVVGALLFAIIEKVVGVAELYDRTAAVIRPCSMRAELVTDVISRPYARHHLDPAAREQYLNPTFQELFYEWHLTLTPNQPVGGLVLTIDHVTEADRFRVTPEQRPLSELKPRWLSGFTEPERTPDYHARTVGFDHVGPGAVATVTIRRRLLAPIISAPSLPRIAELTAAGCRTNTTTEAADPDAEARRLTTLAMAFVEKGIRSPAVQGPLPLRTDPGDLSPDEAQGTIELRCKDVECNTMTMNQLEVHLGESPDEHARDLNIGRTSDAARVLEHIFGCVRGPDCTLSDDSPPRELFEFGMCDGTIANVEQLARLQEALQGIAAGIGPEGMP